MKHIDRRAFIRAGLAISTAGAFAACSDTGYGHSGRRLVLPGDERLEEANRVLGATRSYTLTALRSRVDLGGPKVDTWTYNGVVPGREIRVRKGDVIEARLVNRLPTGTTIHWHGLPVPNDMDGVPDVTQIPVEPGGFFTYRFRIDVPGTYWFHPHVGVQQDRGLYAPLIVEDPDEPARYDEEWVVVLDDWIDGVTATPDEVLASLQARADHATPSPTPTQSHAPASTRFHQWLRKGDSPLLANAHSPLLGGHAGDVNHPYHLINGRVATAPRTFTAKPGQRVRIRFLNAGSDTAYRVAIGGHRMLVTHTDGYPVKPVETEALLLGMAERYDVLVTLGDGVFPLVALAEGKNATALALIRTGAGRPPAAGVRPRELEGRLIGYQHLKPTPDVLLPAKDPDVEHRLELTGSMDKYDWGINGRAFDHEHAITAREGQRVRMTFMNKTRMWHPMHLHGHTFQMNGTGPRKDTVNVLPGQTVTCDFDADNPGRWMLHCHNVYHSESGMMTLLTY